MWTRDECTYVAVGVDRTHSLLDHLLAGACNRVALDRTSNNNYFSLQETGAADPQCDISARVSIESVTKTSNTA